jgi:hypothetical protein
MYVRAVWYSNKLRANKDTETLSASTKKSFLLSRSEDFLFVVFQTIMPELCGSEAWDLPRVNFQLDLNGSFSYWILILQEHSVLSSYPAGMELHACCFAFFSTLIISNPCVSEPSTSLYQVPARWSPAQQTPLFAFPVSMELLASNSSPLQNFCLIPPLYCKQVIPLDAMRVGRAVGAVIFSVPVHPITHALAPSDI